MTSVILKCSGGNTITLPYSDIQNITTLYNIITDCGHTCGIVQIPFEEIDVCSIQLILDIMHKNIQLQTVNIELLCHTLNAANILECKSVYDEIIVYVIDIIQKTDTYKLRDTFQEERIWSNREYKKIQEEDKWWFPLKGAYSEILKKIHA